MASEAWQDGRWYVSWSFERAWQRRGVDSVPLAPASRGEQGRSPSQGSTARWTTCQPLSATRQLAHHPQHTDSGLSVLAVVCPPALAKPCPAEPRCPSAFTTSTPSWLSPAKREGPGVASAACGQRPDSSVRSRSAVQKQEGKCTL